MTNQQIQPYASEDGQISVAVTQGFDTLWLTQLQMGELFGTTPENVLMRVKDIFRDMGLDETATKDFLVVRQEGKRKVRRNLKHYNLGAIISVGYRVNFSRATQLRIRANNALKQHLAEGYIINQRRLKERGIAFEQIFTIW